MIGDPVCPVHGELLAGLQACDRCERAPEYPDEALFEMPPAWEEMWEGMPEFAQADRRPVSSLKVMFASDEDRRAFMRLIGASPHRTAGVWYPVRQRRQYEHVPQSTPLQPGRYPVYIISKGRAESRLTERSLERLGLPYRLVVEPQERDEYVAHGADRTRVLQLPFSNLGQGSIPARNFVWEHAVEGGHKRHWILDDNIRNFARLHAGENRLILDENPFIACEQFADQHDNVALAGLGSGSV